MRRYIVFNGAVPTTAAQVKAALGTSIKTQLQIKPVGLHGIHIIEWGFEIDAAVAFGTVELIETDVAATVTAVTPTPYGHDQTAALSVGGTAATGFAASAEGTITATRLLDIGIVGPTLTKLKQFPLGREPWSIVSKFLRIRTTMSVAVNGIGYIIFEE